MEQSVSRIFAFLQSVLVRNSAVSFSDSRERHLTSSLLPKHPRFQKYRMRSSAEILVLDLQRT